MITFDAAKDATNRVKHGISLAEAEFADWNYALFRPDTRKDYGEARFNALVPIRDRLYCCVYVTRNGGKRIISLRKANQREFDRYHARKID